MTTQSVLRLKGFHRLLLWILFLLLTAVILVYPAGLPYEYHAIQTLYVFDNWPVFAALFSLWVTFALWLVFNPGGDWEKLSIVCIFALVYYGFWAVRFSGRDALEAYGYAYLMSDIAQGNAPSSVFTMVILGSVTQQITGMDIAPSLERLLSLFLPLLSAALLYCLFKSILADNRLASFAALVFILATAIVARTYPFQQRYLGWVLLLLCITLIFSRKEDVPILSGGQGRLLLALAFAALAMTHAASALFLILILIAAYLIYQIVSRLRHVRGAALAGEKANPATQAVGRAVEVEFSLGLIMLFLVVFLGWNLAYGTHTFQSAVLSFPKSLDELVSRLMEIVGRVSSEEAARHVGQRLPLWGNAIELFWLALSVGLGVILGLRALLKVRKLGSVERMAIGGLVAAILSAVPMMLASEAGGEYYKVFYFVPMFTVPLLVSFLPFLQRRGIAIWLLPLLIVLAFPTFLVHNKEIPLQMRFPEEISAAEFIGATYDPVTSPRVSSSYRRWDMHRFYAPQALLYHVYNLFVPRDVERLVAELRDTSDKPKMFLFFKTGVTFGTQYGGHASPILADWQEIDAALAQKSKIYENGLVQIFYTY